MNFPCTNNNFPIFSNEQQLHWYPPQCDQPQRPYLHSSGTASVKTSTAFDENAVAKKIIAIK